MTDSEYIECTDCSFVLLADASTEPVPKRQERCPDCDGTQFEFL